jgi:hypothetical protein
VTKAVEWPTVDRLIPGNLQSLCRKMVVRLTCFSNYLEQALASGRVRHC